MTGKYAPGIKRCMVARMRKTLVENPGQRSAEGWAFLAGMGVNAARKYLEWMVSRDEAVAVKVQQPVREITLYEAVA